MISKKEYPALDPQFDHLFARHATVWDLASKHTRKGETYNIDCVFIAPNKTTADALKTALHQSHKSPVTIGQQEKPETGFLVEWETPKVDLSYQTVRTLIVYCYCVASMHGCKFNGWGVLMPVG